MPKPEALLAAMTLPEKLGQLTMTASSYAVTGPVIAGDSTEAIRAGTIGNLLNMVGADHVNEMQRIAVNESRLGIPLLIGLDVLHGHRTVFPIPLAEAGLFDPLLWERSARAAALEASADGLAMTFAPMLDVTRDPRWGRGAESPGEDPWVGECFAAAKVRGFQGEDLARPDAIAAVAKHYCAQGAVTAGRDYATVDVAERSVREVHFPPFAAAVRAGVAALMPAFTDLAGVPMTANARLLRGWLREEMGFDGVIISDYNAIGELLRHGVAADLAEAAALALNAGVDIDMMADAYRRGLPTALQRGLVTLAAIDAAVLRVLRLKERLGLFEAPYRRGATALPVTVHAAHQALAREIATRSLVLLTNRGAALPLAPALKRLAIIGPLGDSSIDMRGPWWGAAAEEGHTTVLAGLRAALPNAVIQHVAGVSVDGEDHEGIAAALALCDTAEAIVLCVGETAAMSGEAASRAYLGLPGRQAALCDAVISHVAGQGKPVIVVLFSGRALAVPELAARADALLAAWFPGSAAGHAIADVLLGRHAPTGRSTVTWPRTIGQVPIYYAQRSGGRPENPQDHYTSKYLDESNAPLFHFGHGLTYSHFEWSNLRVTPQLIGVADSVEVLVDIRNAGDRDGEETVFCFTHDPVASVARPALELRATAHLSLKAGATSTAKLRFPAASLSFPGLDLAPRFEAGDLWVLVGPSADQARLLKAWIRVSTPAGH